MTGEPHRSEARSACLFVVLLSALAVGFGSNARASGDAALCERAILHGAREVGVPVEVLHAISLTETGGRREGGFKPYPWAVNREGQGHWFRNRDEVLAFAQASLAEGRPSFDLGCFQINYRYHGHQFPSLEVMVDPEAGAVYAARFLRELYAELGDWSLAAGAYHSRTPEFAQRYRSRFDRILAGLGGAPATQLAQAVAPEPSAPARPVPVRQIRGPKIITIAPTSPGQDAAPPPAETAGPDGGLPASRLFVNTVDDAVAPLAAGSKL